MKTFSSCLLLVFVVSCASGKERSYTASTPADPVVRTFLGISLSDSIDFIRWKIVLRDKDYALNCNYGIGKPNTNGFMNGGKKIECSGRLEYEKNYYILHNNGKTLKIAELNPDLLHIMTPDNTLLNGNGGWSYTINNLSPSITDNISMKANPTAIKDSIAFEGRTPCGVPGIIPAGVTCYKLKWYIVFYGNPEKNEPTTCRIFGTRYRKEGGRRGTWKIIRDNKGRINYQVSDENGNTFLYLEKIDENILLFTDAKGKLLTGNEDFSFTLNKRF
jgi:hypothetical protein